MFCLYGGEKRMNGNMTPEERGRVIMMGVLRAGVAAYLIYLGYSLIRDHLNGSSTLAPWVSWGFGVFFMLAGAGFAWYAWKRYRKDTQEKPADESGNSPEEIPGTAEIRWSARHRRRPQMPVKRLARRHRRR